MLWLDEIQGGIWQSNKDTQEAQRCTYLWFISVPVACGVTPRSCFSVQLGREMGCGQGQFARRRTVGEVVCDFRHFLNCSGDDSLPG